jgi:glutamyl-tRNA reductase
MLTRQPWVMALQAGASSADARARLASEVEEQLAGHGDWIALSTCHRLEVYGFGAMPALETPAPVLAGEEAVRHVMRVAAGLESAIVGEDEILHQVREALKQARESRALDGRLQRLFETAIAAGRRARAGRTASSGNLAQKAVAWLEQRSPLSGNQVLVVGAGRMASNLAHAARLAGAEITIASRDASKAHRLAQVYEGRGIDLATGAGLAPQTVAVAVALAGPWHELRARPGELPPIADISAPTAIPASIRAGLNGGFLGIDDLFVRADTVPGGYTDDAVRVVAAKTSEYMRWLG